MRQQSHVKQTTTDKWNHHFRGADEDVANIIIVPEAAEKSSSVTDDDPLSQSFNIDCLEIGTDTKRLADKTAHRNTTSGSNGNDDNDNGNDDGF